MNLYPPPVGQARDSYAPPRVNLPRDPPQVNESTEDLKRTLRLSRRTVLGAPEQADPRGPAPVGDIVGPIAVAQGVEALLQQLLAAQERDYTLNYLSMVAQSDSITDVLPPLYGDRIGSSADYFALVENKTDNPIRVDVIAELVNPGAGFKLSFGRNSSDVTKIDVLALTATGRVRSVPIILGGGQTLWVANWDTTFALDATSVLRVRIFDAAKLLSGAATRPPPGLSR